jgi:endonuclease YncB( thermonuclease family)
LRRALILAGAAALVAAASASAPASAPAASRGPCVPGTSGPQCTIWTGKVTFVDDGDTINVDLAGGGHSAPRIRIAGIQAMEQTAYSSDPARRRGDCNALQATERLNQLVRAAHGRVRLTAQNPGTRSLGRPVRSAALRIGGRWVDVGTTQLREGHALYVALRAEWAWNTRYREDAQRAAIAGENLWNPSQCGAGPSPDARLRVTVNWDADGDDERNVDGEWVRVRNLDASTPVPIAGWSLRDSALRHFTFPAGAVVPAGGAITLFVGSGASGGDVFHWGQRAAVFENATHDERAMGDGGYLFDPLGNLRAWSQYPCVVACADPLAGALRLTVDPRAKQESATIENSSGAPVELEGYRLEAYPRGYAFPQGTTIAPGGSLRVLIGGAGGADGPGVLHWDTGVAGPVLNNAGGAVRITTFTDVTIACAAWGSGSCPAA